AAEHGCCQRPGAQANRPGCEIMQPFYGAAGLAVRGQGQLDQGVVFAGDPQENRARCLTYKQRPSAGLPLPPDPERGFTPLTLDAERGDRMVFAADAVTARYSARASLWICWNRGSWASRWDANQKKPSIWQTWLRGISRLEPPQRPSSSRRARAIRIPRVRWPSA